MQNRVLTFALCILLGFMLVRLIGGSPSGPLTITPEAGLDETQAEFLRERIVEVATGKRDSGLIRELTNFDWDTVCLIGPNWRPPKATGADIQGTVETRLFDPKFVGDDSYFHLIFGKGGIRNMTVRVKRTEVFDYDWKGKSPLGCRAADAYFTIRRDPGQETRYLEMR